MIEQFGHENTFKHFLHKTYGAKPLLLIKKSIWSPFKRCSFTFSRVFDDINDFHFIKGKVEETLIQEKNLPSKISLLRLDTDWYESTKTELNSLYPIMMEWSPNEWVVEEINKSSIKQMSLF